MVKEAAYRFSALDSGGTSGGGYLTWPSPFSGVPLPLPGGKKASESRDLSSVHSHDRTPSNPSPLTFRNNQIQILQTSSTHATMAANVFQQDTNTHGTGCHTHARTYNARQRDKSADSPATHSRTGGETNVVLQQQRIVRVLLPLRQLGLESSVTYCVCILSFLVGREKESCPSNDIQDTTDCMFLSLIHI